MDEQQDTPSSPLPHTQSKLHRHSNIRMGNRVKEPRQWNLKKHKKVQF